MNIILLSGGSGKRLWPLSNEIRSKQFIKFLKKNNQEYESMVQKVFNQIKNIDKKAKITIATSKSQVSSIFNQLGNSVNISIEPCRKDTFPAIVLACSYLYKVNNLSLDEPIIICPVDPYVNDDFFRLFEKISLEVATDKSKLALIGIEPIYPSEKYGYIIPKSNEEISEVLHFKEKPTEKKAKEYISQGGLWNGGVFAFKLSYIKEKALQFFGTFDYDELYSSYEKMNRISFDYSVVEKETSIHVIKYCGEWRDIGSWNTLTDVMSENVIGDGIIDSTSDGVHIVNELDIPILAMGLQNVIISASPDGILVSEKDASCNIKPYVDKMEKDVMYAEKSWGCFKVIDVEQESLTIKVTIEAGDKMNYHSHKKRDEIWVVVSGEGRTIIEGMVQLISTGDVVTMEAGCRHTVEAITKLVMIEIQLGKEITVYDKEKFSI